MKRKRGRFFESGNIIPVVLTAAAFVGFLSAISLLVIPVGSEVEADMRIEPPFGIAEVGETFTVSIVVESNTPVNVFAGELTFNSDILVVKSIDYNISIADLWAERPWYSNGDGTLNFVGGTTKGGFIGTAKLITITFETIKQGEGILALQDARILEHNGLGTDAVLAKPIETIINVETPDNKLQRTPLGTPFKIVPTPPTTDLNGDGRQSIADLSIFMLNVGSDDERFDFNLDGNVDLRDLNILLAVM